MFLLLHLVFGLRSVKLQLYISLAFTISLLWFQCISCDELPQGPSAGTWTCLCASSNLGTDSHALGANCSTACDCKPNTIGPNGDEWECVCAAEREPAKLSKVHGANCFTACNCTSGSPDSSGVARKLISSKVVVYSLLAFAMLATVAFVTSVACCFYHKDKRRIQSTVFSPDKDTSCNSTTKLISRRSASIPQYQANMKSHFNPLIGCIHNAYFMFRGKTGIIPGAIIQFSFSELEQATNEFSNSNRIGYGGSSVVYNGLLKDGRAVAIKRLKSHGGPNADFEFLTEIELISRLNHCHVVPLLGYCSESQGRYAERLIVFEYMPNGNLRDCLDVTQGNQPLDWGTRVGIALGAARGLEYLHEAAAPRILHRDVKSTNIMLDEKWRAKITDLGMAKCLKTDDLPSCSNSPARMQGTFGYFAPECAITGKASLKSDVFSFGVVLLELISGRQPINKSYKKGEESLVIWATPRLSNCNWLVSELADPLLNGNFPEEEMQIMGYLAWECLQLDPDSRPTMSEVAQGLSTIGPDRSKWISLPRNLSKSSMSHGMKDVAVDVEMLERSTNVVSGGELTSDASREWPLHCCSLPSAIALNICENGLKEVNPLTDTVMSIDYIERLVLSTAKARSLQMPEEEYVDLTEPRFESFVEASVQSH